MPAIDPTRLAHQLEHLKNGSNDPDEIARIVANLIEEYSEPTKSPAPSVPAPVMRSLRRTLHQKEQTEAISTAIWKIGMTDARLLAAGLLEQIEKPGVAGTAERWAGQNVVVEIVRELGERGLSGWRRADPVSFLKQLSSWLEDGKRRSQVLAVYAMRGRLKDPDFEDLPSVLGVIDGRVAGVRGEMREAMVALVTALAEVAPEETDNFLLEQGSSPFINALRERIDTKRVGVV